MSEPIVSPVSPLLANDPNFGSLTGQDQYGKYFDLLSRVFSYLMKCYELAAAHETHEAAAVRDFLERLLYTVQVLRLKYTYQPADERPLWIDMTQSGLPNHMEINNLSTDLASRQSLLEDIPAMALLKRTAMDIMLQEHREPTDILCQLSKRTYLEMLDPAKLFLAFTPGQLVARAPDEKHRGYLYTWGCYDFETNKAYIHILTFYQDVEEEPLEAQGQAYHEFLRVVATEGSRAPDVGTLALLIDDALESIHPKALKRICLGPLCSLLLPNSSPCAEDPSHSAMHCPLKQWGRDDDFVFFFSDEIIMSERQQFTRSVFAPRGRIREVFWIPEADAECYRRHASVVHHNVLLPHDLLQELGTVFVCMPQMIKATKFAYTRKGEIHGI